MTRKDSYSWKCILCDSATSNNNVVCYECQYEVIGKQKHYRGTITEAHLYFIKNKTVDMITIQEEVKKLYPDLVWNLDELSNEQAKHLTKVLLDIKNEREQDETN